MEYRVITTDYALSCLMKTQDYISKKLHSPIAAGDLVERITSAIQSLAILPNRHALVKWQPWKRRGTRKMPVGNYNVYYQVVDKDNTVWVIGIFNGRRDQRRALHTIPSTSIPQ